MPGLGSRGAWERREPRARRAGGGVDGLAHASAQRPVVVVGLQGGKPSLHVNTTRQLPTGYAKDGSNRCEPACFNSACPFKRWERQGLRGQQPSQERWRPAPGLDQDRYLRADGFSRRSRPQVCSLVRTRNPGTPSTWRRAPGPGTGTPYAVSCGIAGWCPYGKKARMTRRKSNHKG